jgi:hypothetical protein
VDQLVDQRKVNVGVDLREGGRRGQLDLGSVVVEVLPVLADGAQLMWVGPVDVDFPVGQPEDLLPVLAQLAGVEDGLDNQGLLSLGIVGLARSLCPP